MDDIVTTRRRILAQIVDAKGLANVSRIAGKPDRQINDMIAGRKAFGDRVARELEPRLRPDLLPGWLVFAGQTPPAIIPGAPHPTGAGQPDAALYGLAHDLAREAHDLASLWLSLPPDRRETVRKILQKEARAAISHEIPVTNITENPAGVAYDRALSPSRPAAMGGKKKTAGKKPAGGK